MNGGCQQNAGDAFEFSSFAQCKIHMYWGACVRSKTVKGQGGMVEDRVCVWIHVHAYLSSLVCTNVCVLTGLSQGECVVGLSETSGFAGCVWGLWVICSCLHSRETTEETSSWHRSPLRASRLLTVLKRYCLGLPASYEEQTATNILYVCFWLMDHLDLRPAALFVWRMFFQIRGCFH